MRLHFSHTLAPLQYHFPILMNVRLQFGEEKRTKTALGPLYVTIAGLTQSAVFQHRLNRKSALAPLAIKRS